MVSHIVGGGLGVLALTLCVIVSALHKDPWAVVGSAIYGASFVCLYAMSSIYHGLKHEFSKKVMQVLDHCTIYFLIAGTYTPICLSLLGGKLGWGLFAAIAVCAVAGLAVNIGKLQLLFC